MKMCPYCHGTKEDRFFVLGRNGVARHPTGWALACRACSRRHARIVANVKRRYASALLEQGGRCAACGEPPAPGRPLEIDICHRTWLFRGLVHRVCNNALGMMGDDPKRLRSLAHYIDHAFDGRVIQPRLDGEVSA